MKNSMIIDLIIDRELCNDLGLGCSFVPLGIPHEVKIYKC